MGRLSGPNGVNGDGHERRRHFSYLNLPVNDLIDAFAAGGAVPGSGTGVAVVGAISGAFISTVASLTLAKKIDRYIPFHPRAAFILKKSGELVRSLKAAADEDSALFQKVIESRIARDRTSNPKEREVLHQLGLAYQKKATDLPLQMAEDCLVLSGFGLELYEKGFQAVRGDSAVATSCARAAAQGALTIVNLNLKPFTNIPWAKSCRKIASNLFIKSQLLEMQFGKHLRDSLAPEVCE